MANLLLHAIRHMLADFMDTAAYGPAVLGMLQRFAMTFQQRQPCVVQAIRVSVSFDTNIAKTSVTELD